MQLGGGIGRGSLFGTPQSGLGAGGGLTGGLGSTNTSGGLFGARPGGLFGGAQQSTGGGLFSQTPASQGGGLFNTGATAGGGLGLFQTPGQGGGLAQQKSTFGGGLFGQSPGTSLSTGLGGGGSGMLGGGGGLFSQSQTTPSSGLFKSQSAATGLGGTTGGLFGTQNKGGLGMLGGLGGATVTKFEPVAGTDTLSKGGSIQTVNTKLHCISAMKQHEQNSVEEIRLADYLAGRKGGSGGGLGTGVSNTGGILGTQSTLGGLGGGGTMFGQNKTLGGGGGGLFGQTSQQQQLGGLGTATSTGGLFGQQQKVGGGLFNTSTQNTLGGLGSTGGMFNQQASQAGGIFGTQTSTIGGGGGLFGNQTNTSGVAGLGGTQLGGGLFNRGATGLGTGLQSSQAGSLFNKPLGTTSTLGGGLSLGGQPQLGGGGLSLGTGLGGTGGLGGGLGTGLNTGLGGLGGQNRLGGGLMSGTGLGAMGGVQNANLGQTTLQSVSLQQQQAHLNQQLENLANSPFGDSPLFRSALSDAAKRKTKDSSTPIQSKVTPALTPHYKLNMRPSPKLKPKSLSSPVRRRERSKIFEGLDDFHVPPVGVAGSGETFVPRSHSSIKKLKIKPKPMDPVPDSTTPPHSESHQLGTTPTGSHTAAFQSTPTPPPPIRQQDVSMESPQISIGLMKPTPVRPRTTPTSVSITPPVVSTSLGGMAASTSPLSREISPPRSFVGSGSLTRSPLRPRPCGVTLPAGYHTVPTLDELDSITDTDNSTCPVKGFSIGRRGYGEVHFPGITDVYGMNLEQLVSIGPKEVVVYPDDSKKPRQGEGLNKRAVVSLEGNWPVDKSTREAIKDPDRIEKMGYIHKLERMTEKIGASFQGYDPKTGVCRFEVNHFSKYKLVADDDSDDDGQEVGGVKKIKTQVTSKQPATSVGATRMDTRQSNRQPVLETRQSAFQRTDEDESMSEEDEFEDAVGVATSTEPLPPPLPISEQLATSMGVQAHRVQVMKASFFGIDDPPHHQRSDVPRLQTTPLQRHGLLRTNHQQTTPLRTVNISHTPPSSTLQAQSAVLMSKHDLGTLVPYRDSLVKGKERLIADHGLFMGRSFRVGWGPNWTLSHSGVQMSNSNAKVRGGGSLFAGFGRSLTGSSITDGLPVRALVERVAVCEKENTAAYYRKFLEVQLAHTEFSRVSPTQCTLTSGNVLLHALAELIKTTSTEGQAAEQLKRVLELAVALWGDLPGDCDPDPESYDNNMARKRNVYQWLKTTNSSITKQDANPGHYLKALFSLVAGQQLSEACKLAHEHKDHKLALLISQATQNTIYNRAYVRKQLNEWKGQGSDQYIDRDRLKLYVLLSGEMVWELSHEVRAPHETVNVCEGLDWKRVLALHLCYGCVPSSNIDTVLSTYLHAFQGEHMYATPPQPPYSEECHTPSDEPHPSDTCFHLLQLYCHRHHSLEETLNPAASVPHHLDYGVSWLLWSILTALGYSHMASTRQAQLHSSFSSQLEQDGEWQWAGFVLQHIADPALMENAVHELLARNCSSSEELTEKELFVLEHLHMSNEWVYAAKAQRASYEKNYELEAHHLLEAGRWNDAHTVIVKHLAADAIINDESEDLLHMLELLSDLDRFAVVTNWDTGGSVYLDFLRIGDQLLSLGEGPSQVSGQLMEDLHLGLNALAGRIGQMECHTPKEILCQAEMAKRTATYTKLVLSLKHPDEPVDVRGEFTQILSQLPLPSDYALVEYRTLIQPCLNELAKCY